MKGVVHAAHDLKARQGHLDELPLHRVEQVAELQRRLGARLGEGR